MKNLTLLFVLFLVVCSCTHKRGVSYWKQPYRVGDSLFFVSSDSGKIEKIVVWKIGKYCNPHDPLALLPKWVRTTSVTAKNNNGHVVTVLKVHRTRRDTAFVFDLKLGRRNWFDLDSGNPSPYKYPNTTVIDTERSPSPFNILKDTYEIDIKEYGHDLEKDSVTLEKIIWSRDYGYLEFQFKNDKFYKLWKFIRNDTLIYECGIKE